MTGGEATTARDTPSKGKPDTTIICPFINAKVAYPPEKLVEGTTG